MKRFIVKCAILTIVLYGLVVSMNLIADSANLFKHKMVVKMSEELSSGNIVRSPGDFDEGELTELMIASDSFSYDTVVLGSSSVIYVPWEGDCFVAGLSGAYLKDMIAVVGILESKDKLPKKIIIGLDPWNLKEDGGSQRHTSIKKYSDYEIALFEGKNEEEASRHLQSSDLGAVAEKVSELFSFSYFQSSVDYINKSGWRNIPSIIKREVTVLSEDEAKSLPAIYPKGGRSLTSTASVTDMDNEANYYVSEGSIMYLGDHYPAVSEYNVDLLRKFLSHLKEAGVETELYITPMYPVLYDYVKTSGNYEGVIETERLLGVIAAEEGAKLCGSFDPSKIGLDKEDFADVFHLLPESGLKDYKTILE